MKSKIIVNIEHLEDIDRYKKVGINTFLFALKDFCVGYENVFEEKIINEYPDNFVLINRILDCDDVDRLRGLLPTLKVKGIIYEDIAVFNLVKELGLDWELIFFQNHVGTNSESINFWLAKGVDAVFISNELTKEEIKNISVNTAGRVVIQVLGYNQIMYSRRLLLSNYNDNFQLPRRYYGTIEEISSKIKFRVMENQDGTVVYSEKVFNGLELMDLNAKYFYINSTFLSFEEIVNFLNGNSKVESDRGFLDKETIFKLRGQ